MKRFSQLALPYIVWAALMLVLPMGLIAVYSFMERGNSIIPFSFSLEHYIKFFTDRDFLLILWRSLMIAVKTTVICLILGYPAAYVIARSREKVQNALILCITIPMWINMLVRTYAWIGLLSEGGLIQRIFGALGLGDMELLYTEGAVLLGMVYNFLPFMILQIQASLSKMDNSLLEASADLGASPAQTFRRVTLPLSIPGVINGITLVFLTVGEWNFGSAISMIMAAIMMLLMMAVRKAEAHSRGDDLEKGGRSEGKGMAGRGRGIWLGG